MSETQGKNVVGVVCRGTCSEQEVLVFIPKDTSKTVCANNYVDFPVLVRTFLKGNRDVHFDFESIPKEVRVYETLEVKGCTPLTKSQKQNFLDQYFR